MNTNGNQAKSVANLYLALAIVTTILVVPVLGGLLNVWGLLGAASLILAIFVIVKGGKIGAPKNGAVLIITGAVINIISVVVLYGFVGTAGAMGENATTSYQAGEAIGTAIGGAMIAGVVGIVAWVLLVIGVIFSYMAYSKLKTQASLTDNGTAVVE